MTSTQTLPTLPANTATPRSPEWLYCEIMRHIEPDLLPGTADHLDRIYKGETAAEHERRMAAYDRAFALFDTVYADVTSMIESEARDLRRKALSASKGREAAERGGELNRIDDIIATRLRNA